MALIKGMDIGGGFSLTPYVWFAVLLFGGGYLLHELLPQNYKSERSTLVNTVFEKYDLNRDNKIDGSELEKFLADYRLNTK